MSGSAARSGGEISRRAFLSSLGALAAGWMAAQIGARETIFVGGLLALLSAVIAKWRSA